MKWALVVQLLYLFTIVLVCFLVKRYFIQPYTLPKRIWAYWDSNVPNSIQKNIETNKRILSDWEYNFITESTLQQYLDTTSFPGQYTDLSPQHKADYIRLELLKQYGGVWMDAGILIHSQSAINKLYNEAVATNSQLSAFTLTEEEEYYIENWFIMAPIHSPVIQAWSHEYARAVQTGFANYKQSIFQEGSIRIIEKIYKQHDTNVYLTQHACLQAVLQKRLKQPTIVVLYRSEETMFKLHIECDWKPECVKDRILNDPSIQQIKFIKLRVEDRETNE
jgi:hypothetical protein